MPTKRPNAEAGYAGFSFTNMLQECLACGVVIIGTEGKIVSLTGEAARVLRLPANQPLPASSEKLLPPVQALLREAQTTQQAVTDRQVLLHPDSAAPVVISVLPLPGALGQPAGVVVVLNDLLPARRLEHGLRRLDRLASIGTLSASMAHEIKNALVAVRTFVDLLLEKNPDADLAGIVRREMGRVDAIIGDMLKFAAPSQPTFVPVRLHEILDHSLRLVQHRLQGKAISFDCQYRAASDAFCGDNRQLEQAFVNLLINAVEAIGAEGAVRVGTDLVSNDAQPKLRDGNDSAAFLRVTIADTGPGISAENLRRIFEPFFTTKQNGTGLGLPVTWRIIEEHRGTIRVESEPGKGAMFIILLPADAEAK